MYQTAEVTLNAYRKGGSGAEYTLIRGVVHVGMYVEAGKKLQAFRKRYEDAGKVTDSALSGKSSKFRITTSQRT